jgi:hypothetical protein
MHTKYTAKEAVGIIESFWKQCLSTKQLISEVLDTNTTSGHLKQLPFEDLTTHLRLQTVRSRIKRCIMRLCRKAYIIMKKEHIRVPYIQEDKLQPFFATFMIAYRPTRVFETMRYCQQELRDAAIKLIQQFEHTCTQIAKGSQRIGKYDSLHFLLLLVDYLEKFNIWKVPDEAKLVNGIKVILVTFYRTLDGLQNNQDPNVMATRQELVTQIQRLRSKLIDLRGDHELSLFDTERRSFSSVQIEEYIIKSKTDLNNDEIAHVLLLDPSFQLTNRDNCIVTNYFVSMIEDKFDDTFWQILVKDLTGVIPCYVCVFYVLNTLKEEISVLANTQLADRVKNSWNFNSLQDQVELNKATVSCWKNVMANIKEAMLQIENDVPNTDISIAYTEFMDLPIDTDKHYFAMMLCNTLKVYVKIVCRLRFDRLNEKMRNISPFISLRGIHIERRKFQIKQEEGKISLARTKVCILFQMHVCFTNYLHLYRTGYTKQS